MDFGIDRIARGIVAWWWSFPDIDCVIIDRSAPKPLQEHGVLHEIAHMLLEHVGQRLAHTIAAQFRQLDSHAVLRALARDINRYDDPDEPTRRRLPRSSRSRPRSVSTHVLHRRPPATSEGAPRVASQAFHPRPSNTICTGTSGPCGNASSTRPACPASSLSPRSRIPPSSTFFCGAWSSSP